MRQKQFFAEIVLKKKLFQKKIILINISTNNPRQQGIKADGLLEKRLLKMIKFRISFFNNCQRI